MNNFKGFLTFLLGVAVGGISTFFLLKKKYESDVENEVNEVREAYKKNSRIDSESVEDETKEDEGVSPTHERSSLDAEKHEKARINLEKNPPEDYTRFYKPSDIVVEEPKPSKESSQISYRDPYVISPNEFGEDESYQQMHVVLNPNGIITDEDTGEEIDDYSGMLGTEWEGSIGEYEVNTVRIRNERLSLDIELVQELPKPVESPTIIVAGTTSQKSSRRPHQIEGDEEGK